MAKKEALPNMHKKVPKPRYLHIPGVKEGSVSNKTILDPAGAQGPRNTRMPAEITYNFFADRATPVTNDEHADWLLLNLASSGIREVACVELQPRVEEFHPQFTDKWRRGEYDESRVIKVSTPRYTYDLDQVIQTGAELKAQLEGGRAPAPAREAVRAKPVEEKTSLFTLTVAELKKRLKKRGLPVGGTKDELIERLTTEE